MTITNPARVATAGLLTAACLGIAGLSSSSAATNPCTNPGNLIVGTAGNNVLVGTPGRDIILGRGGNDTIRGMGGNDSLYGQNGFDTLIGGNGNDCLFGGPDDDNLSGHLASHTPSGDNDLLDGGAGEGDYAWYYEQAGWTRVEYGKY